MIVAQTVYRSPWLIAFSKRSSRGGSDPGALSLSGSGISSSITMGIEHVNRSTVFAPYKKNVVERVFAASEESKGAALDHNLSRQAPAQTRRPRSGVRSSLSLV